MATSRTLDPLDDPRPGGGVRPGFDHVGLIVADLDRCGRLLEGLGFRLTARADHHRTNERGERVSAGSSQRSVMLGHGYVEIMQITDPAAGHPLSLAPSVRHGLHVLAFGTTDAAGCQRACVGRGLTVGQPREWERPITEGRQVGTARFRYFDAPWTPRDPSYFCWVEHLTPGLLRPPGLLVHANGAQALTGIQYRGPREAARSWTRQVAAAAGTDAQSSANGCGVTMGATRIDIDVDDALPRVLPVALILHGARLRELASRSRSLGLAVLDGPGGEVALDLREDTGMYWVFMSSAQSRPASSLAWR